jgi:alpha-1,6-mannosyltransferase
VTGPAAGCGAAAPVRIVQLANLVSPTSGGIRTTIERLRAGYAAAGHDPVLVIPGARPARHRDAHGEVVVVPAPVVPGTGGYRMIADVRGVRRLLAELTPDRVEVHDRFTLRVVGPWAAARAVPSVVVVHERLDRLAGMHLPWIARPAVWARRDDAALADRFDVVVTPSAFAADPFRQVGAAVEVVRWGVDLDRFRPDRRSAVVRRRLLGDQQVLLAMVCRLSPEKRPALAVEALAGMRRLGVDARLVVAGTGSADAAVRRAARGLPVTFLGHLSSRDHVAELLAAADVAVCPGPIETFGLAALESLASGTPVVGNRAGAVAELLAAPSGEAVYGHGSAMAAAAVRLLDAGPAAREAARATAERHPWDRAVAHVLHLHDLGPRPLPAEVGHVRR